MLHRLLLVSKVSLLFLSLFVILTVAWPAAKTNCVMTFLADKLQKIDISQQNPYRLRIKSLQSDFETAALASTFGTFLKSSEQNIYYRWSIGRLALAAGDIPNAHEALDPLQEIASHNSLMQLDVINSLSVSEVVVLENKTSLSTGLKAISDTIALAHLVEGDKQSLMRALYWRPEDVSAHTKLLENLDKQAYTDLVYQEHLEALQLFPISAFQATHPDLLLHLTKAIPTLVANKLWDTDTAVTVVKYLIWNNSTNSDIENLLKGLGNTYPTEPAWTYLLGELYQRRGSDKQSVAYYQVALTIDKEYWPALRQLAFMLLDKGCGIVDPSELKYLNTMYESILLSRPDDVLILKAQASLSLCDYLQSDSSTLSGHLAKLLSEEEYVAETLGLNWGEFKLGPNLIENGRFAQWKADTPLGFTFLKYPGVNGIEGEFAGGNQKLNGNAARILTLRSMAASDGSLPYAEYASNKIIINHQQYLVSVEYCLSNFEAGHVLVHLGEYDIPGGASLLNVFLPDEKEGCSTARMIITGPIQPTAVSLVVRNWGNGDVSIQRVALQEIVEEAPSR